MRAGQAVIWYRRMSAVYALGAWTLLGSLFFLGGKKSKLSGTALWQDLSPGLPLSVGRTQGSYRRLRCASSPQFILQNLGTVA